MHRYHFAASRDSARLVSTVRAAEINGEGDKPARISKGSGRCCCRRQQKAGRESKFGANRAAAAAANQIAAFSAYCLGEIACTHFCRCSCVQFTLAWGTTEGETTPNFLNKEIQGQS